jgi:hypothetical protein
MKITKMIVIVALLIIAITSNVSASKGYDNKYVNIIPDYNYAQPGAPGFVNFYISASLAEDTRVWYKNDEKNASPFDFSFHYDGSVIDGQNPDYELAMVTGDGSSGIKRLAAGDYTSYLQNGHGGQPEIRHFTVGQGYTTEVVFLGHAVSSIPKDLKFIPIPTPTITIPPTPITTTMPTPNITTVPTPVTTGTPVPTISPTVIPTVVPTGTPVIPPTLPTPITTTVPTPTITETPTPVPTGTPVIPPTMPTPIPTPFCYTIHHDAITHTVTVVDHKAWDETVIDMPAHKEYRKIVPCWDDHNIRIECFDRCYGEWLDKKPDCGEYETRIVPAVTHIVHHKAITHTELVIDKPAWDESVCDGYHIT